MTARIRETRGAREHPVIELILNRARSNSQPLKRDDPFKLGLVVEGGAMRGVVSAGMLAALEYMDLLHVCDAVYGASAGAFNAAFFVAGQAAYGTPIYYEELRTGPFIRYSRALAGGPLVSLEYVLGTVLLESKILDWKAVIDSPIPLSIVASSLGKLGPHVFANYRSREDLFSVLHASARIPILAGAPVEIDGDRFLDAVIFEPIPVHAAIRDNCTHVLALLTQPKGTAREKPYPVERIFVPGRLDKMKDGLGTCYLEVDRLYRETLSFIREAEASHKPPYLFSVSLPETHRPIGIVARNEKQLRRGARDGFDAVLKTLLIESPRGTSIPAPNDRSGRPLIVQP